MIWVAIGLLVIVLTIVIVVIIIANKHKEDDDNNNDNNDPNDDDNRPEPNPPIPGESIDVDGILQVYKLDSFDENLLNYKFDNKNGVVDNWDSDTAQLSTIGQKLTVALRYVIGHPNDEKSKKIMAIYEDWVTRFKKKMDDVGGYSKVIPWGTNWYQFCVVVPLTFTMYLVIPNATQKDFVANLSKLIVTAPNVALTHDRDGANIVYLSGSYLMWNWHLGSLKSALADPIYANTVNFMELNPLTTKYGDGRHLDGSFITHTNATLTSYLISLDVDLTWYIYYCDPRLQSGMDRISETKKLMLHKSIPTATLGMYGRSNNLTYPTYAKSTNGIKVMPQIAYIRYFTDKYSFNMRAQLKDLAFYESDKTNDTQGQHWVQYRNVHTANTSPELQFPEPGFICKNSQTNYIRIATTTSTTTTFTPKSGKGYSFVYNNVGYVYNYYKITQFGEYAVLETIVVTTKSITITIQIENSEKEVLNYFSVDKETPIDDYRKSLVKFPIDPSTTKIFQTVFDLNKGTVITQPVSSIDVSRFATSEDGCILLDDAGKPYSGMINNGDIPGELTVAGNKFKFDEKTNQYLYVKSE